MSIARQAIELFNTDAALHEIETYLWLYNESLHIIADDLRERILRRNRGGGRNCQ